MNRAASVSGEPQTGVVGPQFVGPSASRRRLDFIAFAVLPVTAVQVAGYPMSELAMILAVGVGLLRGSSRTRPLPGWFPGLLILLLTWMTVVALLQGITPVRRLGHLALYVLLAILLATGRFAMRSVASGLACGLVVAAGAGLVGVGSGYEGRLTGLLGDPNLAGFYLLTLGAVAVAHLPKGRGRFVFAVGVGVLILLTLSRTSILATGLVGVWIVAGRRLSPLINMALLAGLLYGVARISDFIRLAGPFSERVGSDALRDRIVFLEHSQIDTGPWYGNGPGTSTVSIDGSPFFFHNSYFGLLNEGGWIAVILFVVLGVATLYALARLDRPRRNLWLEGAVIAAATCAVNLGEVLLELPTAVVLGAAMCHIASGKAPRPPDTGGLVPTARTAASSVERGAGHQSLDDRGPGEGARTLRSAAGRRTPPRL